MPSPLATARPPSSLTWTQAVASLGLTGFPSPHSPLPTCTLLCSQWGLSESSVSTSIVTGVKATTYGTDLSPFSRLPSQLQTHRPPHPSQSLSSSFHLCICCSLFLECCSSPLQSANSLSSFGADAVCSMGLVPLQCLYLCVGLSNICPPLGFQHHTGEDLDLS